MISEQELCEIEKQFVGPDAYRVHALVDEIRRLRAELEFYADEKNWCQTTAYDNQTTIAMEDGGARARGALND